MKSVRQQPLAKLRSPSILNSREFVIPSKGRDLHFTANGRSLASLGMTFTTGLPVLAFALPHEQAGTGAGRSDPPNLDRTILTGLTGSHVITLANRAREVLY